MLPLHLKQPRFPHLRFEYHQNSKKVYVVRVGVTPEVGVGIADDITTEGGAQMAVLIWLRGYASAKSELNLGSKRDG